MCGICGFYGDFPPQLLSEMNASIAHRGPDDEDELTFSYNNSLIGLGHRRLSIIDLSADGKQPLSIDCPMCRCEQKQANKDKVWLSFNGEIYNYQAIRKSLLADGHKLKTNTDSEVILHLYRKYGLELFDHLDGIYAFAIYDNGELILARDKLGVKPLYYAETASGFLFASELKSLLKYPHISKEVDIEAIHSYLSYLWAPSPLTPLKAVKKLAPGEALIINNSKIKKSWRFFRLPAYQPNKLTEKENIERLYTLLYQSVQKQMVADVPIGAFLSGGVDSSAIVAMMKKSYPQLDLPCYCIAFTGDTKEECESDLYYARLVAKHLQVELREIIIRPQDMLAYIDRMIYFLDEPQADPAPINTFIITQKAHADGIKVLMSGAGGDDLFSGYRRHLSLKLESLWPILPKLLKNSIASYCRKTMTNNKLRRASKLLSEIDKSSEERITNYFLWSTNKQRLSLFNESHQQFIREQQQRLPLLNAMKKNQHQGDLLHRTLLIELEYFLCDHNLNYTDKMSMANGVEVRVPLVDIELVNFSATIPSKYKIQGKECKSILKKSLLNELPKEVLYRSKTGFGAPLRNWIKHDLKNDIKKLLAPEVIESRGLFDAKSIKKLIIDTEDGNVDGAYLIFSLLCIEKWFDFYL